MLSVLVSDKPSVKVKKSTAKDDSRVGAVGYCRNGVWVKRRRVGAKDKGQKLVNDVVPGLVALLVTFCHSKGKHILR